MVLSSITNPLANLANNLFTKGIVAYKFCSRTISVGYTNYLTPTVSVVAKGALALLSSKTAQASVLVGTAAYFANKGYKVYQAHNAKQPTKADILQARMDLDQAKSDLQSAEQALENADDNAKAAAQTKLDTVRTEATKRENNLNVLLAANSKKELAKALAPSVLGVVASVAAAAFAVLR